MGASKAMFYLHASSTGRGWPLGSQWGLGTGVGMGGRVEVQSILGHKAGNFIATGVEAKTLVEMPMQYVAQAAPMTSLSVLA
mmetsp:Transcript_94009/g.196147  ORF Transcript_94009/g.196147 Transcript_94009/m.196147 type:complete len:82 (-) Transcript_94009:1037-1282(-)